MVEGTNESFLARKLSELKFSNSSGPCACIHLLLVSIARSFTLHVYTRKGISLMMIRTSQLWIPKQSHLLWVLIAAPLSRLTKKQPNPVKNPLSHSVPSCVHSVKSAKKACRPCFLPRLFQRDHLCSLLTRASTISVTQPPSNGCAAKQSNYNCSEGNWCLLPPLLLLMFSLRTTRWQGTTRQELRFPPVGQRKIRLSCVRFTKKFDSRFFSEQWNQIAARINTKCWGERRTLIHRLEKTCLFWKQKDGTLSLSFPTKNYE